MARHKTILLFLCRFVLLYALLLLPWARWRVFYGDSFRKVCSAVFASENGPHEVSFEASKDEAADMRIVLADRALLNPDGSGPVRNVDVETAGFWRATALLLALIVATPVSLRRRGWALLWGTTAMHCVILLSISFLIWNEFTYLSTQMLTPFRKQFADGLGEAIVDQFSLATPVLLWVLVLFRRGDERMLK